MVGQAKTRPIIVRQNANRNPKFDEQPSLQCAPFRQVGCENATPFVCVDTLVLWRKRSRGGQGTWQLRTDSIAALFQELRVKLRKARRTFSSRVTVGLTNFAFASVPE